MLFIVSSPSGAGKTTLIANLLQNFPNIGMSVSVTTREPRLNEKDGIDYYFKTKEEYNKIVQNNEFLEYAEFCGNGYGTPKSEIDRLYGIGEKTIIFDIEWQGANQIRSHNKFDIVSIFILPPSFDILKQRLINRKTNNDIDIENRLNTAKIDISHANEYDYVIINNDLEVAKNEISSIYQAETTKRKKMLNIQSLQ